MAGERIRNNIHYRSLLAANVDFEPLEYTLEITNEMGRHTKGTSYNCSLVLACLKELRLVMCNLNFRWLVQSLRQQQGFVLFVPAECLLEIREKFLFLIGVLEPR